MTNKTRATYKKTGVTIAAIAAFFLITATVPKTEAANPKMLITWSADSYAPAGFRGKILPNKSSAVTAAVEVIEGGKLANLSKQTIYWYLNNKFIGGGAGVQTITFNIPEFSSSAVELMVQIPEYSSGLLFKRASIPVVTPEAVITAPYPGKVFRGATVKVKATPYFFSTALSNLKYKWTVNGENFEYEEDPDELTVDINADAEAGSVLSIGAHIENVKNKLEVVSKNINLKLIK